MPVPPPDSRRCAGLTRRELVRAGGAAPLAWLVAGCTLSGPGGDDPRSAEQRLATDPDLALLTAAVAQVDDLVRLCERLVEQRTEVAERVRPALAIHRRHADVLGAASIQPSARPSAQPSDRPSTRPESLPRERGALLRLVARAEQQAARVHLGQVERAGSGQFAQLLAAISASESQLATAMEAPA